MWCQSCNTLSDKQLCLVCKKRLATYSFAALYSNRCPSCGRPVLDEAYPCDFCDRGLISYGFHEDLLEKLISDYKHGGKLSIANLLCDIVEDLIRPFKNAVLIPIPSSYRGKRNRGFDQMALITRILAHRLNLDVIHLLGQQPRSQYTLLSREQRQKNNTLVIRKQALKQMRTYTSQNRTFILLDDIYTTGSTCKSALDLMQATFGATAILCVLAKA